MARKVYDAAYLDFVSKRYDLALQGFQEYLERHPRTERAHDAQYLIGEIYYAKGDFIRANDELLKVI